MTHWKDLPATYAPKGGVLKTIEGVYEDAPDPYGRVRMTTAGGSAAVAVCSSVGHCQRECGFDIIMRTNLEKVT